MSGQLEHEVKISLDSYSSRIFEIIMSGLLWFTTILHDYPQNKFMHLVHIMLKICVEINLCNLNFWAINVHAYSISRASDKNESCRHNAAWGVFHKLCLQQEWMGGFMKCQLYSIILFSKTVNQGG